MTKLFSYIEVHEAIKLHVLLMRRVGETRFGVFDKSLVESALARPKHEASLKKADVIEQAATLLYGLIRSHPWVGGNKRTASLLTSVFLKRNGTKLAATADEIIDICRRIESRRASLKTVEKWVKLHVET